MLSLLDLPEVQSSIAPLLVSLITGLILLRWAPRWTGISVFAGFMTTSLLIYGTTFIPLTGTRKLVLAIAAATIAGVAIELSMSNPLRRRAVLAGLAVLAYGWVAYRVLLNQEALTFWLYLIGGVLYCAWLVLIFDLIRDNNGATSASVIALGAGTSLCAILSASAVLGQLAAGLAAGAGALWLLLLAKPELRLGSETVFSAALGLGLMGMGGLLFAKLPWFTLVLLGLIPLISYLPRITVLRYWQQAVSYLLLASVVAAFAVASAWLPMEDSASMY